MLSSSTIRRINDDLAIAGQVTSTQLKEAVCEGYHSVLNLRSPDELGFPDTEQQEAELLGLNYQNIPVNAETLDRALTLRVLRQIDVLEKPILIHCGNAVIAAAIALMHVAVSQGLTIEQAFQQVEAMGLLHQSVRERSREVSSN
ncbi:MAG: sulfur transferase domain-containing protein [Oculatellaceae cyanobacterium bins.114]|nr:sulfur transferase domain-containing protein [Oculatellaceae cyanobacterium bins.114]